MLSYRNVTCRNSEFYNSFPAARSATILPDCAFVTPVAGVDYNLYSQYVHRLNWPGIDAPGHMNPLIHIPVVFEVTARIQQEECYLTTMGFKHRGGAWPVASCWLGPPKDGAGIAEWDEMMRRMDDITTSTFDVDVSDQYFLSSKCEEQSRLLQIIWRSKHVISMVRIFIHILYSKSRTENVDFYAVSATEEDGDCLFSIEWVSISPHEIQVKSHLANWSGCSSKYLTVVVLYTVNW